MLDTLKIALCLKLCRHNLPDLSHDCLWVSYSRAAQPSGGGGGGLLLSNFNVTLKSLSHGEGWGKTGS